MDNTKKKSYGIDGVIRKNNCVGFSYREEVKKEIFVQKIEEKKVPKEEYSKGLRIGPDTNIEDFFIPPSKEIFFEFQKQEQRIKERERDYAKESKIFLQNSLSCNQKVQEEDISKKNLFVKNSFASKLKDRKILPEKDFFLKSLEKKQYKFEKKQEITSSLPNYTKNLQREISFDTPKFKPSPFYKKESPLYLLKEEKSLVQGDPFFSGAFFGKNYKKTPEKREIVFEPKKKKEKPSLLASEKKETFFSKKIIWKPFCKKNNVQKGRPFSFGTYREALLFSLKNSFSHFSSFSMTAILLFLFFSVSFFIFRGISLQGHVLGVSSEGIGDVFTAIEEMKGLNFVDSRESFDNAAKRFEYIATDFDAWAGLLKNSSKSLPFFSKISSGSNALEAATSLSLAGKEMSVAVETIIAIGNPFENVDIHDTTLLETLRTFSKHVVLAKGHISNAYENVENIRLENLPEEKRETFLLVKTSLPEAEKLMEQYIENMEVFEDILGANGPRKYLFLLQNPHEIRATGGFIGSYGLLSMKNGHIQDFFIDGIFNPDGQLTVDVIPPEPIRKVSSGWSLHDSNWFADFPSSAKKAMHFYEKGGGPTVDGVIAITPELLKYFLRITGPVYLEEYDVSIDEKNFMESLQYQVEEGYDREENTPKKILNDLAPLLVKKVFENSKDIQASEILEILYQALAEKQVLLYSRNDQIQKLYSSAGWAGEILETDYDYLNVIHSNINGFKTDRVIDEMIKHNSEIRPDGSILNTVTIRREHLGGDTLYDWYNQVNADYMRIYVPKGSKLISVSGHTREKVRDPLDYDALGFLYDEDLKKIEETLSAHEESGTQVFEESGKTVFGNWVYVSPKESVIVTYTYVLPFRFDMQNKKNPHIFSLLSQKQAGLKERQYTYSITYPETWNVTWKTSRLEKKGDRELFQSGNWNKDIFVGLVFESL
ncbi:MAG: DUF4012 domain-containing protein [Candidatus Moranbacteria bacterium]|nr:DUF4012 domain-containing protein [Candidatus Moranbacteria bacterium]